MAKIKKYDEASLKKIINKEITKGNIAEAGQLINRLWETEHENETVVMPEDFVEKIIRQGKRGSEMKLKKLIKASAIGLLVFSGISASVYAAVSHYRAVAVKDYGFAVGEILTENQPEGKITDNEAESGFFPEDTEEIRKTMDQLNDAIEVLSTEEGKSGDKWYRKVTSVDNTPLYMSDDGLKWTLNTEAKGTLCEEYRYKDITDAAADFGLSGLFDQNFEKYASITDYAAYRKYFPEQGNVMDTKELFAACRYRDGGTFEMTVQWSNAAVEGEVNSIVITGKTENSRSYHAQDGTVYTLADSQADGIVRTNTVVSCQAYTLMLTFEGMGEQEIEKVLDGLHTSVLSK